MVTLAELEAQWVRPKNLGLLRKPMEIKRDSWLFVFFFHVLSCAALSEAKNEHDAKKPGHFAILSSLKSVLLRPSSEKEAEFNSRVFSFCVWEVKYPEVFAVFHPVGCLRSAHSPCQVSQTSLSVRHGESLEDEMFTRSWEDKRKCENHRFFAALQIVDLFFKTDFSCQVCFSFCE